MEIYVSKSKKQRVWNGILAFAILTPWRQDEDALLKEGFEKYRNKRIVDTLEENERNEENILSLIKNEFFATSERTKEDLKHRARTLDLKFHPKNDELWVTIFEW